MIDEQASAYPHKYDLLFVYVLVCIHLALKLQPAEEEQANNVASRLTDAFKMMLAAQFPIATPHEPVNAASSTGIRR